MTAIQSLYIRNIEKQVNAEYIANTFSKNGLAQVRKVYIEPYKYKNYNRAYVEIETWHETEAAYSFIKRLRNSKTETRLVHVDDDWWLVNINKNQSKFASNNRVLTVFSEPIDDDSISTMAIGDLSLVNVTEDYDIDEYLREIEEEREQWYEDEFVKVDAVKTQQLRDIISSFKEKNEIKIMLVEDNDSAEMEAYLREMDWVRNAHLSLALGYLL
jgi:hypothetical protein